MEQQDPVPPVPFTTLHAFLERLHEQQAGLIEGATPDAHCSKGRYRMPELAQLDNETVSRVAYLLRQVVAELQARFPDEHAWRDADGPVLEDTIFLKGGPVLGFQIALVAELRKLSNALSKAAESHREDQYGTAYNDTVRVQRPFRP